MKLHFPLSIDYQSKITIENITYKDYYHASECLKPSSFRIWIYLLLDGRGFIDVRPFEFAKIVRISPGMVKDIFEDLIKNKYLLLCDETTNTYKFNPQGEENE